MLNCTDIMAVLEKLELPEILSNPTVMSLAVGSPGQAIAHYQQLRSIPQSLLVELCKPLSKALAAMQTAKDIALKTSVNSIDLLQKLVRQIQFWGDEAHSCTNQRSD